MAESECTWDLEESVEELAVSSFDEAWSVYEESVVLVDNRVRACRYRKRDIALSIVFLELVLGNFLIDLMGHGI